MFRIDTNETITKKRRIGKEMLPYLESATSVIPEQLEVGDLSFLGRNVEGRLELEIGVEFKSLPRDLVASLRDGRLISQLIRMVNHYDLSYLLLVGPKLRTNFESGKLQEKRKKGGKMKWIDTPFSYHYLNSTLARFEASGGLIRQSNDIREAAAFLLSLRRYWHKRRKEGSDGVVFVKKRYKPLDWRMMENPLAEIYERMGIGIKKALVLAEWCPTIGELVSATDDELLSLPEFGKGTVAKIRRAVSEGYDS